MIPREPSPRPSLAEIAAFTITFFAVVSAGMFLLLTR